MEELPRSKSILIRSLLLQYWVLASVPPNTALQADKGNLSRLLRRKSYASLPLPLSLVVRSFFAMYWLLVLYRLFCASLLGFFAFVPIYVGVGAIAVVVAEPQKFDLFFVVVVVVCALLAYFLLLLTYRAATGRGRKKDDALLPPVVMAALVVFFGLCGVAAVVYGVLQGKWPAVVGGVAYVLLSLGVWRTRREDETPT